MKMEEDASSMVSNAKTTNVSCSNNSSFGLHQPVAKRMKLHDHHHHHKNDSIIKFKGVVPQQNGHWGAQIYANHQRIWLGTFKSERKAAMAYDSAAIKIRGGDSQGNFPWTETNSQKRNLQNQYSTEAVLNMIRDGTYQPKFADYLRVQSQRDQDDTGVCLNQIMVRGDDRFTCRLLCQKELTPSDVGKLNRLVIHKKYVVKYFLYINENREENNNAINGGVEDVELGFYDKYMRPWKFRYCFWRSSQSYVFTRGWNRLVKEKKLKEKILSHFTYVNALQRSEGQSCNLLEIQMQLGQNIEKIFSRTYEEKQSASNSEEKGFRLFGVQIN